MPAFCIVCKKNVGKLQEGYFKVDYCEGWDEKLNQPSYTSAKILACSLDCLIKWAKNVKEVEEET